MAKKQKADEAQPAAILEQGMIALDQIKINTDNPRTITDAQLDKLKKSIEAFPDMLHIRPIVINKDNIALGGNMRTRALIELGYKEVPFIRVDIPTEREREFIIKDNLSFGEFDYALLYAEWDLEQLAEWGLSLAGKDYEDFTAVEGDIEPYDTLKTFLKIEVPGTLRDSVKEITAAVEGLLKEKGWHDCKVS
jgi:ParB-like chromosome segregation protein Spo0J